MRCIAQRPLGRMGEIAMSKRKVLIEESKIEKILRCATMWMALAFAAYRIVMSIAKYMIVYDGMWARAQAILGNGTILVGLAYLVYIYVISPQNHVPTRPDMKRVFMPEYWLLLGMLVWALLSCWSTSSVYTATDWWGANKNIYYDFAAQILILYPLGIFLARRRDWKPLRAALGAAVLIAAGLCAYVLYRVFINRPISLSNGGGVGMDSSLCLIMNCNRNTAGIFGYIGVFLSLCMLYLGKKWLKPLYAIAMIVFFMITTLTQSRTCIIAICVTLGGAAGLFFLHQKKICFSGKITQWIVGIILGIAVAALLFLLRGVMYELYLNVSHVMDYMNLAESDRFLNQDVSDLSGRGEIWMNSLKAMVYDVRSFFFGITPAGVPYRASESNPMYTHNQFLEVGVAFGVPALLAFVAYVVLMVKDCVVSCLRKNGVDFRDALIALGLFLLLFGNMTEATLFGYSFVSGELFIILCGWIAFRAREKKEIG